MSRPAAATLPLAFLLAMAADASAAALTDVNDRAIPLEAGALRQLLDRATDAHIGTGNMDQSGDRRLPGEKTAQFFPNFPNFPNFHNCFSGFWRNC